MKKYILLICLLFSLKLNGASPTLSGTNTFTGNNTWNSSNQVFPNGLQISPGFWLNGVWVTNVNFAVTNFTEIITNLLSNTNFYDAVTNILGTNGSIINNAFFSYNVTNSLFFVENGDIMVPKIINGQTNIYWIDFHPQYGGPMYGSLLATNVYTELQLITNCFLWKLYSFNIDSSKTNSTILWPTNLFTHQNTNGLGISSSFYYLILTNGNEFRGTVQSNYNGLSLTWATFGQ